MAQRPASEGRDSRPHHISSIVHHFFDQESGPGAADRHRRRELAVGSPTAGPLAAWACAGLARGLAAESLILGESSRLTWSATSYLAAAMLQILDIPGHDRPDRDGEQRFWQVAVPDRPADQTRKRGRDPAEQTRIMLRHLGTMTDRRLDDLEAVHLGSHPNPTVLPGRDALVWCLSRREAVSLGSAYTLGRALALLRPFQLEILVVDPGVLPPARETVRGGDDRLILDRCRKLVAAAGGSSLAHVSHLRATTGSTPPLNDPAFAGLAGRILADHDYD